MACFGQGISYCLFNFDISAFTEVLVAQLAVDSDQVLGGPESIAERVPCAVVVIEYYRPFDAFAFDGFSDVLDFLFEFGCVDAENDQPPVRVLRLPLS